MSGPRVLLLSPHPDDLAWSLGGTMARLSAAEVELVGLTFFTRTRYAPGSPAHGTLDATAVRAAEEAEWAAWSGVRLIRCDLPDSSLRGFDDDTEMGARPEPEIVEVVADRLHVVLEEVRPDVVLVPLAAGWHVDHRAVRLAAANLQALFYDDLPYAAGDRSCHFPHRIVVDVSGFTSALRAGVECFPSQQPELILPVIRRHLAAVSGERIWAETAQPVTRFRALLEPHVPVRRRDRRMELQT